MKLDLAVIEKYIADGLVDKQIHPTLPLSIYNYTRDCQFGRKWDEITMMCRGLFLDTEGNIIARPFRKFFNVEERVSMGLPNPSGTPAVFEKLDGSLGILFWYADQWHIATRGSFTSDQAIEAAKMLAERYAEPIKFLAKDQTHLFEIIYPENRIVVDYGLWRRLIYLGSVFNEHGGESTLVTASWPDRAMRYGELADLNDLPKDVKGTTAEGYVLVYGDGTRAKIKFADYVRLHRILTGLNERAVWEVLKEGKMDDLRKDVPEEFIQWLDSVTSELLAKYKLHEFVVESAWLEAKDKETRKDFAQYVQSHSIAPFTACLFKKYDKKDYSGEIWKAIRPAGGKTFHKDIDV